jgi:hypothetical protein
MPNPWYKRLVDMRVSFFLDVLANTQWKPDCPLFFNPLSTHQPDEPEIFDIPTRIEEETVRLLCEIYDFNKYKNVGKLSVKTKNQPVPIGEYSFTISGSQNNVDYIYSMLKPQVELICLIEMKSNPFGDDKVHKLHITGVKS